MTTPANIPADFALPHDHDEDETETYTYPNFDHQHEPAQLDEHTTIAALITGEWLAHF